MLRRDMIVVVREGLVGMGAFVGYNALVAFLLLTIRACLRLSGELFRKMLHAACVMSVFVLLYAFDTWYMAMFVALAFAAVVYRVIAVAERHTKIMEILQARRNGEVKSSLLIVFVMLATLIAVFWGLLGEQWKYVIVVSVMAWGFGDAAAALVGKAWGRRRIQHLWVEGTKTVEGTFAMYAVSSVAILATLMTYTSLPWYLCLAAAALIAPVSAVVELVSHRGIDTITVPYATAASTLALITLLSFAGVAG